MFRLRRPVVLATAILTLTGTAGLPGIATAENLSSMSCDQLWYVRNAIYARQGYCFRTERARAVFGAGCFPPFGQLGDWLQYRVNEIQAVERQRDCS